MGVTATPTADDDYHIIAFEERTVGPVPANYA